MTQTIDEKREELLRAYEELPEEARRAVAMIISNYDLISRICRTRKYKPEERERMIADAIKRKDEFRLCLVLLERAINGE